MFRLQWSVFCFFLLATFRSSAVLVFSFRIRRGIFLVARFEMLRVNDLDLLVGGVEASNFVHVIPFALHYHDPFPFVRKLLVRIVKHVSAHPGLVAFPEEVFLLG
jgi:hypothetical protein